MQLLKGAAPPDEVVAAAAFAAERDLSSAADDRGFVEAVHLLLRIPQAAASADFEGSLRELGVEVPDAPDLMELVAAVGRRLDHVAESGDRRTDFGELSHRALLGAFTSEIASSLPGLLDATPEDLQAATRRLGSPREFAGLARMFFTTLLEQALRSWLDRTLSAQVGPGRAFADVSGRSAFDRALAQYCMEATRIIREFSEGWYARRLRDGTRLSSEEAQVFGYVVFKKVRDELARKRDANG